MIWRWDPPRVPLALRTPADQRSSVGLLFAHLGGGNRPGKLPGLTPIGVNGGCLEGMGPYPPRLPPAARTPANQGSASGVGASTPCREVSTRGITVSFPVRRICGYGRVSDSDMVSHPPRARRLALRTSANHRSTSVVGASAPCETVLPQRISVFALGLLGL